MKRAEKFWTSCLRIHATGKEFEVPELIEFHLAAANLGITDNHNYNAKNLLVGMGAVFRKKHGGRIAFG